MNTVRKAADDVGKAVFDEDCQRADRIWKEFSTRSMNPVPKRKNAVLYIEVDGSAVNTRVQDQNGSTWREYKLGIFFSFDHIYKWRNKKGETCRKISRKEYVSFIGPASEFKKHVLAAAIRNGYGTYENVVAQSDGAE